MIIFLISLSSHLQKKKKKKKKNEEDMVAGAVGDGFVPLSLLGNILVFHLDLGFSSTI